MPTTPTVRLDVGGKLYRVSKALLETYPDSMLARLVSDTWNAAPEDKEKDELDVLFIERNGERFQHVLDYLRDPDFFATRMDETVLRELDYFGIPFTRPVGLVLQPGLKQRVLKAGGYLLQLYGKRLYSNARKGDYSSKFIGLPSEYMSRGGLNAGDSELFALFEMLTPQHLSEIWIPGIGIKVVSKELDSLRRPPYMKVELQAVPYTRFLM